jgi:hypothetical protein
VDILVNRYSLLNSAVDRREQSILRFSLLALREGTSRPRWLGDWVSIKPAVIRNAEEKVLAFVANLILDDQPFTGLSVRYIRVAFRTTDGETVIVYFFM